MAESTRGKLVAALHFVALIEDGLLAAMLAMMIGLSAAQIFLRDVFHSGLVSGDHLLRVLVLWITMLGSMAASRGDRHMAMDVLSRFLPPRIRLAWRVIVDLFTVVVCAMVAYYAARFAHSDRAAGTIAFSSVPAWLVELILPVGFGVMTLRYSLLALTRIRELVLVISGKAQSSA